MTSYMAHELGNSESKGPARRGLSSFTKICLVISMWTVSFDVFGVINVGFAFRLSQICLLVPMGLVLVNPGAIRHRLPLGFWYLLLWAFSIGLFIPNTGYLLRSVGYFLWLVFDIMMIVTFVLVTRTKGILLFVVKWYLGSFVFVASFGILQFLFAVMHIGDLLVQQWWVPGVLPRVSGFSYEPSYFSTYLLTGWVCLVYLFEAGGLIWSRSQMVAAIIVVSVAMILSSSRMGIAMMVLWTVRYPAKLVARMIRGRINLRLLKISAMVLSVVFLFIVWFFGILRHRMFDLLLQGTGLYGTTAASVYGRLEAFQDVLRVFVKSPIVGYSLGGLSFAIAKLHGVRVGSLLEAKDFEGIGVIPQVLAASGILGFVPFLVYLKHLLQRPLVLGRRLRHSLNGKLLEAFTWGLIYELIILELNQNILRLNLWMHIGVLSSIFAVSARSKLGIDSIE
ncbi:MAG: hypothetical protein JRN15_24365 [Nitrososphaerota archaeon]|nr:hypothetical protein [Nitrososphaerota archaeon]